MGPKLLGIGSIPDREHIAEAEVLGDELQRLAKEWFQAFMERGETTGNREPVSAH